MKMDNCLFTLVFGLSALSVLSESKDQCDRYAEEGQNFTVPLDYELTGLETLKWERDDTTIFHRNKDKIVTKEKEVYQNGSLKLTNLKKEDTGSYIPEVHNADGKAVGGLKSIKLCILDNVPEPKVEIKCSTPSPTKVTFTCNVDKAEGLTFKWLKDKKDVASEEKKDKPHILTQTAEKVEGNLFQCEVSNLASSKISKAVKHECSSPILFIPKDLSGRHFWIMVGRGGLVLLLIIIVIVCYLWDRKKRSKLRVQEPADNVYEERKEESS